MDVPPRQRVLDAAAEVAERSGVAAITLEAVAERAGVSKGGLLHYFPSKAALLAGMVGDIVARYYEEVTAAAAADEDAGLAHAYVVTSAKSAAAAERWTAVLTAGLLQPELLGVLREPARESFARSVRAAEDPVDAAVAWLAADGLWLSDMLGLYDVDPELREAVVSRLRSLAHGGPPSG
jgi:AcrR family transcriptional regulator